MVSGQDNWPHQKEKLRPQFFFLEHSTAASALKPQMHIVEDVHRDQQINRCVIEMIVRDVVRRGIRLVSSIASPEKVHRGSRVAIKKRYIGKLPSRHLPCNKDKGPFEQRISTNHQLFRQVGIFSKTLIAA
jgi:hypothetical protein